MIYQYLYNVCSFPSVIMGFTLFVYVFRATIISRMQGNVSHPDVGNVALPGVMRGGVSGETTISVGSMSSAQHGQVSSEMHHVHGNRQVCLLLTVTRPIHTPVISLPLHLFIVILVFIKISLKKVCFMQQILKKFVLVFPKADKFSNMLKSLLKVEFVRTSWMLILWR